MKSEGRFNLVPPLVEAEKFIDLVKAGQTVSASLSPTDTSLTVFITNSVSLTLSSHCVLRFPFVLGAATANAGR